MLRNQRTNPEKLVAFSGAFVLILCVMLFLPGNSFATGGMCVDCHTMHDSQGGSTMATGGPNANLLMGNGCVGCHTGINDGTNSTPYVYSTGAPTFGTNTLAGGNFYWVRTGGDDTMGHNVYGISNADGTLSAAPGKSTDGCGSPNCHASLVTNCSATSGGCKGCHQSPAHHTSSTGYVSASPWFRWLSGHMGAAGLGVKGIEDDDWNYETSTDHNEYLGNSATKTSAGGLAACGSTMTGFCTGCHGNFHIEYDGSSNWQRHPADHVIPTSGEYDNAFGSAGGGANGTWDPTVPVARPAGFNWAGAASSNVVNPGTDMVMCLSCHVAHGSPYSDMLRWDYDLMIVGTTGGGQGKSCFVCHTQKDG